MSFSVLWVLGEQIVLIIVHVVTMAMDVILQLVPVTVNQDFLEVSICGSTDTSEICLVFFIIV